MDNLDGIETAKILRQRKNHSLIIFVTVLKEYVFNAFEVEAYDYLLKPLDSDHFERTMDRAVSTLAQRTDKSIVIQRGSSCDVVPLAQIMYAQPNWFFAAQQEHSHKPEEQFAIIERLSDGPYLELFARRRQSGWDCWGNEVPGGSDIVIPGYPVPSYSEKITKPDKRKEV